MIRADLTCPGSKARVACNSPPHHLSRKVEMRTFEKCMRVLSVAAALGTTSLAASAASIPNAKPHGIPRHVLPATVLPASVPPIVAKWADAWNRCDSAAMAKLYTTDAIYDDFAFQGRSEGTEGIANWVDITCKNIGNVRVTVLEATQSGDQITIRWVFDGTPPKGTPLATGKSFSVPVLTQLKLKGQLIQYNGDYYNLADLFRQLGIPAGPWTPPAP